MMRVTDAAMTLSVRTTSETPVSVTLPKTTEKDLTAAIARVFALEWAAKLIDC
jgi:hypothetical protein